MMEISITLTEKQDDSWIFIQINVFDAKVINTILTRICTQYVQMNPIANVATTPNARPAFLKAIGIAKIPDPKLPLSRWIKVSISLPTENVTQYLYI
jgi:hypothetical protein